MALIENDIYRFDQFEVDPASRRFSRNGEQIPLYPKAFEVLVYLVANPGRVVTKEEIFKSVWSESFVEEGNLARQVSSLRRAMGDRSDCIVTVPGKGYQFAARVVGAAISDGSAGVTPDSAHDNLPGDVLVQRVRERTQVVIEESFAAPAVAPAHVSLFGRIPRRLASWSVLGLVVVVAAAVLLWTRYSRPPELRKVMVADFLNLTGDSTYNLTMKNALEAQVGQTPWIQLMSAGEVNTALAAMEKPPDTPLLGDTALDVCKRTGYQAMLRPRIESSPDKYGVRISMDVVNCVTGATLTTYKATANSKDELLGTLDALSLRARRKLGEPSKSMDDYQVPFFNATTSSFDALLAYYQGMTLGRKAKFQEAIPYFEKAVQIDPKFAWAHSALAITYYNLGDQPKAAEYAQKAFDLSSNVSEYERIYIRYTYYLTTLHDLDATEKEILEWTEVYPNDMAAWEALTDVEIERGNYPKAIEAGERGLKLVVARAPSTYVVLARAYVRANRLGDAKRVVAEAQAQGMDSQALHEILFNIAAIDHDARAMQHEVDWNKGKPEFYDMSGNQGIIAADEGKYRQFEDIYKASIPQGLKEDGVEQADSMLWEETRIEAALGRYAKAGEFLKQVKDHSGIYGAVIEASAGDVSAAEAYIRKPEQFPHGTIEHFVYLSEVKAMLAMHRGDPAAAIAALEPAAPYELAAPEVIDVRGNAYLAVKQGAKAETEFRKLIANPGLEDPVRPWTVLAHLGLARAFVLQGNKAAGKSEYDNFFALWKDADPDVPVLQQARHEYAQFQ
jgi:DNA-binding winged helix-turn-helix (wHTH) protein/tetratricopeptide (TPR) repeat protein